MSERLDTNENIGISVKQEVFLHQPLDMIQLYKPVMRSQDWKEISELLNRSDLSDDDFDTYLSGGDLPARIDAKDIREKQKEEFHNRRAEIRDLSLKLRTGEAHIDQDGRLVRSGVPRPPNANLPPPPPPGLNNGLPPPRVADLMNGPGNDPQANMGNGNHEGNGPNLTFRRICFAVLTVVTAFLCVILQTLPIIQETEIAATSFDSLLHELLHVKFMKQHLRYCESLNRDPRVLQTWTMTNTFSSRFWYELMVHVSGFDKERDCSDGVLHIPARQVLADDYWYSDRFEAGDLEPYRQGVDYVWHLECVRPPTGSNISRCYSGWKQNDLPGKAIHDKDVDSKSCSVNADRTHACFRGIHDSVISHEEAGIARNVGHRLILNGGDHFDIHYNTTILSEEIPTIMQKLQTLLREKYNQHYLQPAAFRVQAVGPMDFVGVDLTSYGSVGLNTTNYLSWGEKCRRQNEKASYSLPWPFRAKPARDTCRLMADLEADPRFAVHTSVFLSTGAGEHYRGGVSLYIDNHRSNYKPRHKLRRGVSIDGSLGRVVVSSGGIENRRCQMPTRAGLRRVLQIWWDCAP